MQLVRDCCQGELWGAEVGSKAMALVPDTVQAGNYLADTGTAGSCSLLAQVEPHPSLLHVPCLPSQHVFQTLPCMQRDVWRDGPLPRSTVPCLHVA